MHGRDDAYMFPMCVGVCAYTLYKRDKHVRKGGRYCVVVDDMCVLTERMTATVGHPVTSHTMVTVQPTHAAHHGHCVPLVGIG